MRIIKKGATSQSVYFSILDSASTTGGKKTGIAYNTASLTAYYTLNGAAAVAITLATLASASAAWSSGGFVEVSSANAPGLYRLDIPNAGLTGADSVVVSLKGASGMVQVDIEIQLVAVDLQDAVRQGLTALPNANAEAAGGLYTRGTGAGQIAQPANGQIDVALKAILTTTITEGAAGRIAAAWQAFWNVTSPVATAQGVNQTGDSFARIGSTGSGLTSLASATNLATVAGYIDTEIQTIIDRIGAFTGTGVNTVLGFFKALLSKTASTPSDVGGTFDPATDSTEAIRDAGATLTDFGVLASTTFASVASQTSAVLTAGSADNDAYNGCIAIITDQSTAVQKAIGFISDYVGSSKTVTFRYDPGIFAFVAGDLITILPPQVAPGVKKARALANFEFVMIDASDDLSGITGRTVTAERSIDGASFAACANAVSEVGSGLYKINLAATDLDGDVISLKFTATGANATLLTLVTEP